MAKLSWAGDLRLRTADARIGHRTARLGADAQETREAHTERRAIRAELAIEDLLGNTPGPTAEQMQRLRRLLDGAA
ncbi:hypothetical protein [Micromonospora sp. NPDC000442]|uniref:hypothetical protein n=1 Tax=Micromonospora sp. NPDC000442 TaxID=3364217 RepID=UPI00369AD319